MRLTHKEPRPLGSGDEKRSLTVAALESNRRGFTILELLVVIAIIAVLASMIVAASMRVIGMQAQKNATLQVQKVANAYYAQWSAIVEQANGEKLPLLLQQQIQGGADPRVVRQTYINYRLAQQLPQNYAEALNPDGMGGTILGPDPYYLLMLGGANPGDSPAVQSGVCMWLALKNSRNGAIYNQDIFTPQEVVPMNNTQYFCLVDAWQQPLLFGVPLPGPVPTGRVQCTQVINQNTGQPQVVGPGGIVFNAQADLPAQYYYFPVIASQGPPLMNQPIVSYTVTIGGPIGG